MEKLAKLKARMDVISTEMQAIVNAAEKGVLTVEQQASFDALNAEGVTTKQQIDNLQAVEVAAAAAKQVKQSPVVPAPAVVNSESIAIPQSEQIRIPASVRKVSNLKAFKGDEKSAYSFGQWIRAANGIQSAKQWCGDHGIMMAVQNEGTNSAGGFLVPTQFDNAIVDLRLQYGVFRRNARIRPMMGDTLVFPRRSSGLTAYWTNESSSITESDKTWSQIELKAKKLAILTRMSNELSEDAIISVADDLAGEIAYAFAYNEDYAGFVGTGLSTQGHIMGASLALYTAAGSPTTTSAGGVQVGTGNLFSEIVIGDFTATVGRCPSYARLGAKWYCSPIFYDNVMARLAFAAGGINPTEMVNGIPQNRFLGYPVELVEVMPSTDANSQVVAFFGNLAQAASFGDRRQTSLAFDGSRYFEYDQIAVRGTERLDITVHDVGTSTVAGPLVGLVSLNA